MHKIVLASSSSRRQNLLNQIGLPYKVIEPGKVEDSNASDPRIRVKENAVSKVESIVDGVGKAIVIGADTVVVLEEAILEKPEDIEQARDMLQALRGKKHRVFTGLALYDTDSDKRVVTVEETIIHMRDFKDEELEGYLRSKESLGKAGGYAIQGLGALLIEEIEGSYSNVVGLPLSELHEELMKFGINILGKKVWNSNQL